MTKTIIVILTTLMVLNVGIAFANDTTGNGSPKAKMLKELSKSH